MLTVAETERVAAFLTEQGWTWPRTRVRPTEPGRALENRLRDNQIKAVVATSALGMGYDKPDLAFCVHLGSPASPVAYYQQVGRAGRALDDALAVLLPGRGRRADLGVLRHRGDPRPRAQVERILDALGRASR